jgi:hypothetical protein
MIFLRALQVTFIALVTLGVSFSNNNNNKIHLFMVALLWCFCIQVELGVLVDQERLSLSSQKRIRSIFYFLSPLRESKKNALRVGSWSDLLANAGHVARDRRGGETIWRRCA